ncbi:MAG: restriction endonuclease [Porticoccaceae bacterium]|nr:restriction endonuclease [Porticoccaceae bacterium]
MARRTSIVKELLNTSSKLPWWVGVVLAVFSYFFLDYFSGQKTVSPAGKQVIEPDFILGIIGSTFASILKYILPVVFLAGSALSAIASAKRKRLYGKVQGNTNIQTLRGLSWQQFELLVGEYFKRQGFSVKQDAQAGPDGGVDVTVYKDKEKYLVQCKQWRAVQVGLPVVRELLGAISVQGAAGGFVVTSGGFTKPAKDFANGTNIKLIDGAMLLSKIGDYVAEVDSNQVPDIVEIRTPSCPVCGSEMVKRTARTGANTGNVFWGCSAYPRCRGAQAF